MDRTVVLLRAVNVGGRRVAMADLRRGLEEAGCSNVESYVQSGNLVLTPPDGVGEHEAWLSSTVSRICGFDVGVVLRSAASLQALVAANPYPDAGGAQLHVVFFADAPDIDPLETIDLTVFAPDHATVIDREVLLHVPAGMGRSALAVALTKRTNKSTVVSTMRNWNTVTRLTVMATG